MEAQKAVKRFEKKAKDIEMELHDSVRQGKTLNEQIDRHMSDGRKLRQQYEEAVCSKLTLILTLLEKALRKF